jgi:hypothetical protein
MPPSLATLQGKVAVDGINEAVKGLLQVAQAFDVAGQSAGKANKPVDDIVVALAKGLSKNKLSQSCIMAPDSFILEDVLWSYPTHSNRSSLKLPKR